jgi:hypothetical protein
VNVPENMKIAPNKFQYLDLSMNRDIDMLFKLNNLFALTGESMALVFSY